MGKARSAPDIWIIVPTLLLLTIGVIMVYSASSVLAFREFGDSLYYLKRQFIFAVLGVIAMFFTMNVDYLVWKRFARVALFICFAMLIIVLIPGIGVVRGGARSWLGIGAFGIQPSEFMKIGMILYLSEHVIRKPSENNIIQKRLIATAWHHGLSVRSHYAAA